MASIAETEVDSQSTEPDDIASTLLDTDSECEKIELPIKRKVTWALGSALLNIVVVKAHLKSQYRQTPRSTRERRFKRSRRFAGPVGGPVVRIEVKIEVSNE